MSAAGLKAKFSHFDRVTRQKMPPCRRFGKYLLTIPAYLPVRGARRWRIRGVFAGLTIALPAAPATVNWGMDGARRKRRMWTISTKRSEKARQPSKSKLLSKKVMIMAAAGCLVVVAAAAAPTCFSARPCQARSAESRGRKASDLCRFARCAGQPGQCRQRPDAISQGEDRARIARSGAGAQDSAC